MLTRDDFGNLPPEWIEGRPPRMWGRHGFWQVRLRWAAAPIMLFGLLIGLALGFEVSIAPILAIAVASLLYNAVLAWIFSRHKERFERDPKLERLVSLFEVSADYVAIFLLVYFTGGVSSPLVVFLIFHVIITAIQFSAATAYKLAGLAAAMLWLMLLAQLRGWIGLPIFAFNGAQITLLDRPAYAAVMLFFFTATLFITAAMTARVMRRLRQRVGDLARVSSDLAAANDRFRGLYTMATSIGPARRLGPVLETVTAELSKVADVSAVAVKLITGDGDKLRYAATHGLPEEWVGSKILHLERSPLNRRCIDGEVLVTGRVGDEAPLELRQELTDLGFRSAVLAPLKVSDHIIGTLSFYSTRPDRFAAKDTPFLRLAAELVAIAIDNARAYEAVEALLSERAQSMLEVAHNLRAPLSAALSKLELVQEGYAGEVSEQQAEHLNRVAGRLHSLDQTISELLAIARARDWSREIPDVVIDLNELAVETEHTFAQEAARKGVTLEVIAEPELPSIPSGADLLKQVMENLVSNAIKYTPEGGRVTARFERNGEDHVRLQVEDTGIGIPESEQGKLFREFFRASNAKRVTTTGTGLGLALVKRTVERHDGRIRIESREGAGTTVLVDLPLRRKGTDALSTTDPTEDLESR